MAAFTAAFAIASVGGVGVAYAANGERVNDDVGVYNGAYFAGSMKDTSGAQWFCALQDDVPRPQGGWSYTDTWPASPQYFPSDILQTRESIAQIGYLLWKYGSTNNANEAAALKLAYETVGGNGGLWRSLFPQFTSRADEMIAESKKNAGPYTSDVKITADADKLGATASNIAVIGQSGVTDMPFIATISGPGVFEANGKKSIKSSELKGATTARITSTGNGDVKVTVAATEVPGTLYLADPIGGIGVVQVLLLKPEGVEKTFTSNTVELVLSFTPTVTSTIDKLVRAVDDTTPIVDTFKIGVIKGDEWVKSNGKYVTLTAKATLYRASVPEVEASTGNGAAVATQDVVLNGPGEYSAQFDDVTEPGVYYVVADILKANQGDNAQYLAEDVTTNHNIASETTMKQAPVTIKTTMASTMVTGEDPAAWNLDYVNITGLPDDYGTYTTEVNGITPDVETLTYEVYPVTEEDDPDSCLDAKPVFTATVNAVNGEQQVKVKTKEGFAKDTTYVAIISGFPEGGRVALLSDVDGKTPVTHTACTTVSEQFSTTETETATVVEDAKSGGANGGSLAVTGSDTKRLASSGLLLLALGIVLVSTARRRVTAES